MHLLTWIYRFVLRSPYPEGSGAGRSEVQGCGGHGIHSNEPVKFHNNGGERSRNAILSVIIVWGPPDAGYRGGCPLQVQSQPRCVRLHPEDHSVIASAVWETGL